MGGETFVIRDGHGHETLQRFQVANDVIVFDMNEILSYDDVLDRLTHVGGDAVITFDNGDKITLANVSPDSLGPARFSFSAGPVCVLQGTPLLTERGQVAIEDLRPDDILWTKDFGWQALRVVVSEPMVFRDHDDPAKPILIPPGALGPFQPQHHLILSPQHRVLRIDEATGNEVLVPAIDLIGINGIRQMRGKKRATYLNVVMERHCIIQAAGCWVESLLITRSNLSRHTRAARRMLNEAVGMAATRRVESKGVRPRHLKTG